MVPEFDQTSNVNADLSYFIADVKRGVDVLGADFSTPVILVPVSIVRLMNFHTDATGQSEALLDQLLPLYKQHLKDLQGLGVTEVQIHEPVLVQNDATVLPLFKNTYSSIFNVERPAINMASFFEDIGADNYNWLTSVDAISIISLDFTRGENLGLVEKFGFPGRKTLGAGVVDAHNVWKVEPSVVESILENLSTKAVNIRVQTSVSLQFIPWDLSCEKDIILNTAGQALSFTVQKMAEFSLVAKVAKGETKLDAHKSAWAAYRTTLSGDKSVTDRVNALTPKDFVREEPFVVSSFYMTNMYKIFIVCDASESLIT